MLNYNRLKRCLHLAQRIDECLARLMAHSGDSDRQCMDLRLLCHYADRIKIEFIDQETEDAYIELDDEFISSFAKKWGE